MTTVLLPRRVPDAAPHRPVARYVDEEHGRALCGDCGRPLHRVTASLVSWRRWWRHDPRRRTALPAGGGLLP